MNFGRVLWMRSRGEKVLFDCRGMAWKANLGIGGGGEITWRSVERRFRYSLVDMERKFAHGAWDIRGRQ
jgi:hypothetical protein